MAYSMTEEHKAAMAAGRQHYHCQARENTEAQTREFRAWSARAAKAMMLWQENCGRLCDCSYCVEHREATSAIPKFL